MNALLTTVAVFAIALLLFALAVGVGKWLKWRGREPNPYRGGQWWWV